MRRFTRYSIRSLLVLVTLMCVVLGWYAMNVRAYRAERAALARLEAMHGLIGIQIDGTRDPRLHPWCGTGVYGHGTMEQTSPFGVGRLLGSYGEVFLRVKELELDEFKCGLYSETINELTHFSYLSRLTIHGPKILEPDRQRIRAMLPNTRIEFTEWEFAEDFYWTSYRDNLPDDDRIASASAEKIENQMPLPSAVIEVGTPHVKGESDDDPFATDDNDNPFAP